MKIIITESQYQHLINQLNESYSLEQTARIDSLLKRHFGVTTNFNLCGWILRDGAMLAFTYDGVNRNRDHREIAQAQYGKNDNLLCDFDFPKIEEFVSMGNIRIFPMTGFQLGQAPTPHQRTRLSQFIKRCSELYVDISDENGKVVEHFEWYDKRPYVDEVFKKIDGYFDGKNSTQTQSEQNIDYPTILKQCYDNNEKSLTQELLEYYKIGSIYLIKKKGRNGEPRWHIDWLQPQVATVGALNNFLRDLCTMADQHGIVLTSSIWKTARDLREVKAFGFLPNKGRNTDYYYNSNECIRHPKR